MSLAVRLSYLLVEILSDTARLPLPFSQRQRLRRALARLEAAIAACASAMPRNGSSEAE